MSRCCPSDSGSKRRTWGAYALFGPDRRRREGLRAACVSCAGYTTKRSLLMTINSRLFATSAAAALCCGALAGAAAASDAGASAAAKLQIRTGSLGRYVVDGKGFTLYLFEKDKGTKSSCYGACAKTWSPWLVSGRPSVGSGVSGAKVGTTRRTDGTTQATYGGHPLYYYVGDRRAGQTTGEGLKQFGAEWYVLAA